MFSPRKWNVAMLTNVVFWHVVFAFETLICISGHSYHLPVVFYMMFQFFLTLKLHFIKRLSTMRGEELQGGEVQEVL